MQVEAQLARIDVYLEIGSKNTFACAVDWPGWCRSARDDAAALQSLLDSAPAYASVLRSARLGFNPPTSLQQLRVIERLVGNATTDFGAPDVIPSADREPTNPPACARLERLFRAGWRALDAARKRATGKALQKGPRGGGRELEAIVRHVVDADRGYLSALGWRVPPLKEMEDPVKDMRRAIVAGLRAASRGEIPAKGPRGGTRWPVRYFARRVAWHTVAHAWEIERRILPGSRRAARRA